MSSVAFPDVISSGLLSVFLYSENKLIQKEDVMRLFKTLRANRSFWALVNHGVATGFLRLEDSHPVTTHEFRKDCQPLAGLVQHDRRSRKLTRLIEGRIGSSWSTGRNLPRLQEFITDYLDAVFPDNGTTHFGAMLQSRMRECVLAKASKEVVMTCAILAAVEDNSSALAA